MIKVFRQSKGDELARASALAIGAFDGVHKGHQALLAKVRAYAREYALVPAVVSFEPLPRQYFSGETVTRLTPLREKILMLDKCGMDVALMLRFNHAFTQMSAPDFVEGILHRRMQAKTVFVGDDFRFGHKRQGDVALLEKMGKDLGFEVRTLAPIVNDGQRISSTSLRRSLEQHDFSALRRGLGRHFCVTGHVGYGRQLGRTLGYPTANISLARQGLPLRGVFAVLVNIAGNPHVYQGVASLGIRPTVHTLDEPLLEVNLFNFDGNLYGCRLHVALVAKLRDEEKFANLDDLVAQMHQDAAQAKRILVDETD